MWTSLRAAANPGWPAPDKWKKRRPGFVDTGAASISLHDYEAAELNTSKILRELLVVVNE